MDKKKEWISFSETDDNGIFREAYGYFEKSKSRFDPNSNLDELRNHLICSVPLSSVCSPESHDFVRTDEFTGGIKYKCKKCGVEAVSSFLAGDFNKAFHGSIIDGKSFMWKPEYMSSKDITKIKVSYGDCPIRNATISNDTLTYKNSINFSRDGWMQFPKGYFDSHMLLLSAEQKTEVFELLYQLNLPSWKTDSYVFNNLDAPGFCLHDTFECKFNSGYSFICYYPNRYKEFHTLTSLLDNLTGIQHQPQTVTQKMIPGIETPCCEIMIPEHFSYCPKCGVKLVEKYRLVHADISYDFDQTCWLCDCLESNAFNHRFCGNCGKERPW